MLPFHKISAASNPIYRDLKRAIKDGQHPADPALFCVTNHKYVLTALRAGITVHTIFVRADYPAKLLNELKAQTKQQKVRWIMLSAALANGLESSGGGTSVFAYFAKTHLTHQSFALATQKQYVLCDTIRDPTNLGAIVRSAAAFGLDGIFLYSCSAPWNPKAVRASAGCILIAKVAIINDLSQFASALTTKKLALIGMQNTPEAVRLGDVVEKYREAGCMFAFGNEGNGLSAEIKSSCSLFARIPIVSSVDSLNVAATAAATFYELRRAWK